MRLRAVGTVVLVVLATVSVSSCSAGRTSASSREADRHAQVAGVVMTRTNYPIPSNDAAQLVVGTVGDTTIDAMAVEGTAWDGSVTLRIDVTLDRRPPDSTDRTVRCYRYRFDHTHTDTAFHTVACPDTSPVALSAPVAPDLSATGAARLAAALTAIPPGKRTTAVVQATVTSLYPPPVAAAISHVARDHFEIGVGYAGACMTGVLPSAGPAQMAPRPRLTCLGG